MDHPNQKSYFQKNRLFHKLISKNDVNIGNIFSGKNALFLKSINNMLIRDQLNYQHIVMKVEENRSMKKTGRVFFLTFCCTIAPVSGIIDDHNCIVVK